MKILSVLFVSVFVVSGCGRGHRVPWDSLTPEQWSLVAAAVAAEDSGGLVPAEICAALDAEGLLASEVYCAEDYE